MGGLSNVVLFKVERVGYLLAGLESKDVREVKLSACRIGERPEISCDLMSGAVQVATIASDSQMISCTIQRILER